MNPPAYHGSYGGKCRRLHDGDEVRHLHRFLAATPGVPQVRVRGAHQHEREIRRYEQGLHAGDVLPVAFRQRDEPAVAVEKRSGHRREQQYREGHAGARERPQPCARPHPHEPRDQEQAQRPGEHDAPVRQPAHQPRRQRERSEKDDLNGQQPDEPGRPAVQAAFVEDVRPRSARLLPGAVLIAEQRTLRRRSRGPCQQDPADLLLAQTLGVLPDEREGVVVIDDVLICITKVQRKRAGVDAGYALRAFYPRHRERIVDERHACEGGIASETTHQLEAEFS